MGAHIHVGTANRRNVLAFVLLALAMLFNTAVPTVAHKNKCQTTTKAVTPPDSPDPNVKLTSGRQVTDLYYDDETDNTERQLQQLRRLYPDEDSWRAIRG